MLSRASLALFLMLSMASHDPEIDLEQDYARTLKGSSPHALITLIARYEDGTPLRGYISCSGWWFKHDEAEDVDGGRSFPFRTDSRGAVVMNPNLGDEWIVCAAEQDGYRGTVTVEFDADRPVAVREIVLRKE